MRVKNQAVRRPRSVTRYRRVPHREPVGVWVRHKRERHFPAPDTRPSLLALPLHVLVPSQAQLGIVGEVGVELKKERPEVPIQALKIVMIHQGS